MSFCGSEHLQFLISFILKYSICFCCRKQKRVPSLSALWEQLYDPFRMTKRNKVSVWWKVSPGNLLIQVHKSLRVEDSFYFYFLCLLHVLIVVNFFCDSSQFLLLPLSLSLCYDSFLILYSLTMP